jgi:hypothetical protein
MRRATIELISQFMQVAKFLCPYPAPCALLFSVLPSQFVDRPSCANIIYLAFITIFWIFHIRSLGLVKDTTRNDERVMFFVEDAI